MDEHSDAHAGNEIFRILDQSCPSILSKRSNSLAQKLLGRKQLLLIVGTTGPDSNMA